MSGIVVCWFLAYAEEHEGSSAGDVCAPGPVHFGRGKLLACLHGSISEALHAMYTDQLDSRVCSQFMKANGKDGEY